MTSTQETSQDHKLLAKLGNLKTVVQLLKAINFKEFATCYGSANGLKITVEEAKCMQASAYIPANLFQEFDLVEDVMFRINLNVLVECLCIFWTNINMQGSSVALQLYYRGTGFPVTMLIEEDGIIVDCSLKTQEPEDLLDFCMDTQDVINKVILRSELLKDILGDLDPSSEFLEILLSPKAPYFTISTEGVAGECEVELPHNTELVDSFHCTDEAKYFYRLSHIKPAMKAVTCSNKVSMRTDKNGLLCFQYMINTDNGTCFIEYYILPAIESET